jgi:hypothetical protein
MKNFLHFAIFYTRKQYHNKNIPQPYLFLFSKILKKFKVQQA